MVIDGQWVDDEEWLQQQAQLVYDAIQNVKRAAESGDISEKNHHVFQKYVAYYADYERYTPETFWQSSSAIC